MKKGIAPIDSEGKSINLHHVDQTSDGPVVELTATSHFGNFGDLHSNTGQSASLIDRKEFEKWKRKYWRARAKDFK